MPAIPTASKLWHAIKKAVHWLRYLCYFMALIDRHIQASTASATIKTQSANLKTSTDAFCAAVKAYKATL